MKNPIAFSLLLMLLTILLYGCEKRSDKKLEFEYACVQINTTILRSGNVVPVVLGAQEIDEIRRQAHSIEGELIVLFFGKKLEVEEIEKIDTGLEFKMYVYSGKLDLCYSVWPNVEESEVR